MLYIALRRDRDYRLVSYSYHARIQEKRDITFFRHVDFNIPRLVNDKRGQCLIQGSISSDKESSDDYKELLLRTQRFLGEMADNVAAPGFGGTDKSSGGDASGSVTEQMEEVRSLNARAEGLYGLLTALSGPCGA